MIYKIPCSSYDKIEEIYSETGAEYNKRKLTFSMGSVLTELMTINYQQLNTWVDDHFDEFERHRFNMNQCEYFRTLSEESKFLLLFCTKLRFLPIRIGVRHAARRDNYFGDVERAIYFIKNAVDRGNDNEKYFSFFFKHHSRIYNSDGIYASQRDPNILNYFFPIALSYSRNFTY